MDRAVLSSALVLGRNVRLCLQNVNSALLSGTICKKQMFGRRARSPGAQDHAGSGDGSLSGCAAGVGTVPSPFT